MSFLPRLNQRATARALGSVLMPQCSTYCPSRNRTISMTSIATGLLVPLRAQAAVYLGYEKNLQRQKCPAPSRSGSYRCPPELFSVEGGILPRSPQWRPLRSTRERRDRDEEERRTFRWAFDDSARSNDKTLSSRRRTPHSLRRRTPRSSSIRHRALSGHGPRHRWEQPRAERAPSPRSRIQTPRVGDPCSFERQVEWSSRRRGRRRRWCSRSRGRSERVGSRSAND